MAQLAIHSVLTHMADTDALSRLQADYGPWPFTRFSPVDPAIIEAAERDRAALGLQPGPMGSVSIVEFDGTVIPDLGPVTSPSPPTPEKTLPVSPTSPPASPTSPTSPPPTTETPPPSTPTTPPPAPTTPPPPPPRPRRGGTISGIVFEDVNFGGGAGSAYESGIDRPLGGVTVRLFDSGGLQVGTDFITAADGLFSFTVGFNDTFTVYVVSSTIGDLDTPPDGGFNPGASSAVAEQTYEDDGAGGNGGLGALGGDDPTLPDDANVAVTVASGNVPGLEIGFSYDIIVNTNQTGQGSLERFIQNARAINGQNVAEFALPPITTNPNLDFDGSAFTIEPPNVGFTDIDDASGVTTIDGLTQPGGYEIVIEGGSTGAGVSGFVLDSDGNRLSNLTIQNFDAVGVDIASGVGNTVSFNTIDNTQGPAVTVNSSGTALSNNTVNDNTLTSNVLAGSDSIGAVHVLGGADYATVRDNDISASGGDGVRIASPASTNVTIQNNTITNCAAQGMTVRGNSLTITDNEITGSVRAAGIEAIAVTNSTIDTNLVEVSNPSDNPHGITLSDSSSNNTISNNTLRNNDGDGVRIADGANDENTISRNRMSGNGGLGIELVGTANDSVTKPTIDSASMSGPTTLSLTVTLAEPGRVEVFEVDAAPDAAGGEGETFLNFYAAAVSGSVSFSITVSSAPGRDITATLTDSDGNTSEFSLNRPVP